MSARIFSQVPAQPLLPSGRDVRRIIDHRLCRASVTQIAIGDIPCPPTPGRIDTQRAGRYYRRMPIRLWRTASRAFNLAAALTVLAVLAGGATWFPRSIPDRAAFLVAGDQFDFSRWTLEALGLKFTQAARSGIEIGRASCRERV